MKITSAVPFTDSEIKRLLAGEEIEITGLVSSEGVLVVRFPKKGET